MRRTREEAAETRRRAVDTAAKLYRERGIDAVSVADVMSALGMTVGGFYRHFDSKDALVTEACGRAFEEAGRSQDAATASPSGEPLAAFFGRYLSRAHRDTPATGCPVPALLSTAARQPPPVRRMLTSAVRRKLSRLEALVPDADPDAALAAVASMFGALALARAIDDEALSTRLLHDTRRYWTRTLGDRASLDASGGTGHPDLPRRRRAAAPRRRERA